MQGPHTQSVRAFVALSVAFVDDLPIGSSICAFGRACDDLAARPVTGRAQGERRGPRFHVDRRSDTGAAPLLRLGAVPSCPVVGTGAFVAAFDIFVLELSPATRAMKMVKN